MSAPGDIGGEPEAQQEEEEEQDDHGEGRASGTAIAATPGASAVDVALDGTIDDAIDDGEDLDDETREFQSQLYAILEAVAVPVPMEADMLGSVEAPLEQGYSFPKLTAATFVEMVAAICDAGVGRGLWRRRCRGLLDRLFSSPELFRYAHVRNRLAALRVDVKTLEVAVTPVAKGGIAALMKQRGGVFEPALAAVLVRDEATLKALTDRSGKWVRDPEAFGPGSPPRNVLFDWIGSRAGRSVQVIDNVSFDPASCKLRVQLMRANTPPPLYEQQQQQQQQQTVGGGKRGGHKGKRSRGGGAGAGAGAGGEGGAGSGGGGGGGEGGSDVTHPSYLPVQGFEFLVLIDVQEYAVISKPVVLFRKKAA
eukprot:g4640.t1